MVVAYANPTPIAATNQPSQSRVDAICKRAIYLKNLHAPYLDKRQRTRAIMNGGASAMEVLTGSSDEMMPIANLMLSGLTKFGHRLGRVPSTRVDPPRHVESERARKRADKKERIVSYYDGCSKLPMILPQAGRWLPGYGFAAAVLRPKKHPVTGQVYPHIELRDSFEAYPGPWGTMQHPRDITFIRTITLDTLEYDYPDAWRQLRLAQRGPYGAVLLDGTYGAVNSFQSGWENPSGQGVEIHEYINEEGYWTVLPEKRVLLEFIPNYLADRAPFRVAKRFSFDVLAGQYDHTIGLMAGMARMGLLAQIMMEDSIFSPIIVEGDLDEDFEVGRNVVNVVPPGTKVSRLGHNLPYQAFQQIDRLERYLRIEAGYPVQQDAESPNSFVTGRGLQELGGATTEEIREYFLIVGDWVQELDSMRMELDVAINGDRKLLMDGYVAGEPFAETYIPERDLGRVYKTRRVYGAMATWDDPSKIVTGLQLYQADLLSDVTILENLDGVENVHKELARIDARRAETTMMSVIAQKATEGDPAAAMALIDMMPPSEKKNVLLKFFTPQGDEMSPEEMAMAAGGMPGMPGMEAPPMGPPPAITTVLSELQAGGGTRGGLQTVGRLPERAA